jgi:hypothetical protein
MATKKASKVSPRPAAPALVPSTPKAPDDLDKVRELVRILEDSTLSELSYEDSVIAVRLSRASTVAAPAPVYAMPPPAHAPAAAATPAAPEEDASHHVIRSPFVGTFYRAASPDAATFTEVGRDGEEGPDPLHHRGDEADERDRVRRRRQSGGDPGRERQAGAVQRSALPDRGEVVVRPNGSAPVGKVGAAPAATPTPRMFKKILVANRGEIALRVIRAARELDIATVAVYSTADADSLHVKFADEAVCIGPPAAKQSYLHIPAIISAAEITAADAIHPGYGFLSENAHFAEICAQCGFRFIGPSPRGDPDDGRQDRGPAGDGQGGPPLLPGSPEPLTTDAAALSLAKEIGLPLIIKAAAGGGGRGMKIVRNETELPKRVGGRSARGRRGLRQRLGLYRTLRGASAAHRVSGGGRSPRQRDSPR